MKHDIRSLAVGLILGITIAFSIAAKNGDAGSDGRFQITAAGDSAIYFVLDTRTGQVWTNEKREKLD